MTAPRESAAGGDEVALGGAAPEDAEPSPARLGPEFEFPPRAGGGLGIALLALGALAGISGVLLASASLFAAGMVLLALPLVVLLGLLAAAGGLHLVRRAPATTQEGAEVVVELRLENRSRRTCHYPRVSELFPPEIHAQKDLVVTDRLLPGESAAASYAGTAILPRGIYAIGPTMIRLSDPLGWFEVRRRLPARGELVVHPALVELSPPRRGGGAVAAIVENLAAREVGDEDELRGVREYRRGDSPRRIHWPLTARHRVPVVKEFHPAIAGDLHIVLDLHRRMAAGLGRSSTLETAIRIAGSVAREALRLGHRVELLAGGDPARIVPLAGGRDQERAILDELVPLRANEEAPLDDWLDEALARVPRSSTALVFVSPYLFREGAWLAAVDAALGRGVRLITALFDERSYIGIHADAAAELPFERIAERLRAAGSSVVPVPCGSDLIAAFDELARSPAGAG
jgi:uncharacterized protein (DUF58 family)